VATERLYYHDSYLASFTAHVVEASQDHRLVYLDRTAFYPTSGGQPHDLGTLGGVSVEDVIDEDDRVAHRLVTPLTANEVEGRVDWTRRFDHMQQHTGQHLVSAVAARLLGAATTSVHLDHPPPSNWHGKRSSRHRCATSRKPQTRWSPRTGP
jgi:alanyl-tRNA synthetase